MQRGQYSDSVFFQMQQVLITMLPSMDWCACNTHGHWWHEQLGIDYGIQTQYNKLQAQKLLLYVDLWASRTTSLGLFNALIRNWRGLGSFSHGPLHVTLPCIRYVFVVVWLKEIDSNSTSSAKRPPALLEMNPWHSSSWKNNMIWKRCVCKWHNSFSIKQQTKTH